MRPQSRHSIPPPPRARRLPRFVLAAAVALWAGLAPASAGTHNARLEWPQTPLDAPDFSAQTLDGRKVRLRELAGTVVFLNFWATWCVPCRLEMPAMERLHRTLGAKRFRVLAVNMQEPPETVARYAKESNLTFDILLDPDGVLAYAYRVSSLPMTYIVDGRGNVAVRALGARPWDEDAYVNVLQELIRNAAGGGKSAP